MVLRREKFNLASQVVNLSDLLKSSREQAAQRANRATENIQFIDSLKDTTIRVKSHTTFLEAELKAFQNLTESVVLWMLTRCPSSLML